MSDPEHMPDDLRVSVPACVHLFGEGQHILGLPAVLLAGGPRLAIQAEARDDRDVHIIPPGGDAESVLLHDDMTATGRDGPLLAAVIAIGREAGSTLDRGCDLYLDDDVPLCLATGRAAALAVALSVIFANAWGKMDAYSGKDIAALAHSALGRAFGDNAIPGMTLACSLGGLVRTNGADAARGKAFSRRCAGFLLGEIGPPRPLPGDFRDRCRQSLTAVRRYYPHLDIATTSADEILPLLADVAETQAHMMYAILQNRDICVAAGRCLASDETVNDDVIGELLDQHHEMLRDHMGLVSEQEEELAAAACAGGALGAKANTTNGGSVLAFAPDRLEAVREAMEQAGAAVYEFQPDEGMSLESN